MSSRVKQDTVPASSRAAEVVHKISDKNIQATQRHALLALRQSNSVEARGRALQGCGEAIESYGNLIEECGKAAQSYAQESLLYARLLEGEYIDSTKLYREAAQAHFKATRLHIEANKMYAQVVQIKIDQVTAILNRRVQATLRSSTSRISFVNGQTRL